MSDVATFDAIDQKLPPAKLFTLGLQYVLVMYAGAIAVPVIVGRVLNLTPEQVAFLISADLFVCCVVTSIQSLGASKWFGIKLPVMRGVTFTSVGPMVSIAASNPVLDGARMIFGYHHRGWSDRHAACPAVQHVVAAFYRTADRFWYSSGGFNCRVPQRRVQWRKGNFRRRAAGNRKAIGWRPLSLPDHPKAKGPLGPFLVSNLLF